MEEDTLAVFTFKSVEDMLRDGGSSAWHVNRDKASSCKYIVCVKNRNNRKHPPEGSEKHSHAFLIGKVAGVKDLSGGRCIVEFNEYALVDQKVDWRWRDKKYINIRELGFFENEIDLKINQSNLPDLNKISAIDDFAEVIINHIEYEVGDTFVKRQSKKKYSGSHSTHIDYVVESESNLKFEIYFGPVASPKENGFWCGFVSDQHLIQELIGESSGRLAPDYEFSYDDNEDERDMYKRFNSISERFIYGIGYELNSDRKWLGMYKRFADAQYLDKISDLARGVVGHLTAKSDSHLSIEDLQAKADIAFSEDSKNSKVTRNVYYRCLIIRNYVLRRANGICECCSMAAPFLDRRGQPYLESHHLNRISDEGLDHYSNMAAVCPNCHRKIHSSTEGTLLNERLRKKLAGLYGQGKADDGSELKRTGDPIQA